jgi:hypothetical protein
MEIASYIFGAIFAAASLLAGLTISAHRDFAIWTACVAMCALVIATTCWYQNYCWRRDAQATNASQDQRARIVIASVACEPLTPEVEKRLNVIVKITNSGKTPAKRIRAVAVVDPLPKGEKPTYSYSSDPVIQLGILEPNVEHQLRLLPVRSKSTGEERPLPAEIFDQLKSGAIQLFTHGRIDYEDVFGQSHWVTFCYFLLVPFNEHFGVCADHNESDE